MDRIIDVFPPADKETVRAMLSESLMAVVSQSLLKTKDGTGRVAAHEIMVVNAAIRAMIRDNKIAQITGMLPAQRDIGNQTLDQCLQELVRRNAVASAEARSKAVNKTLFGG
jgi:twitching motility protein PilT